MEDQIYLFVLFAMLLGSGVSILYYIFVSFNRSNRDCGDIISSLLGEYHLKYVSSRKPSFMNTGPFPLVELSFGQVQTSRFGVRGEYTIFRIVSLVDQHGKLHESWVKLEFENFQFCVGEWKPDLSTYRVVINKGK